MITRDIVNKLYSFFEKHIKTYNFDDETLEMLRLVKYNHTMNVINLSLEIGKSVVQTEEELMLCEVIGLFHDIGRWEQYYLHNSFNENFCDHGDMSYSIVLNNKVLSSLSDKEQNIILTSIKLHNKKYLPQNIDKYILPFAQIIRDADRLDNYRNKCEVNETNKVKYSMPDTPGITEEMYKCILDKSLTESYMIKSVNDFRFRLFSWVFDMSFPKTFEILTRENYIGQLYKAIKDPTSEIIEAYSVVENHIYINSGGIYAYNSK